MQGQGTADVTLPAHLPAGIWETSAAVGGRLPPGFPGQETLSKPKQPMCREENVWEETITLKL